MQETVDKWMRWAVTRHAEDVVALHGAEFLPTSWEAIGCGAFGCVMRTGFDDVVCKVTIDGSEAFFANFQRKTGHSVGVCEYLEPLRVHSSHGPMWLVWKELAEMPNFESFYHAKVRSHPRSDLFSSKSAKEHEKWLNSSGLKSFDVLRAMTNVGLGVSNSFASFVGRAGKTSDFPRQLARYRRRAADMFNPKERFHGWSYSESSPSEPMLAAALDLLAYRYHLEQLAEFPIVQPLANALNKHLREGVLLADLSPDNIAQISGVWSLIDGGFCVPVNAKWASVWDSEGFDPGIWWDRWRMLDKLSIWNHEV